MTELLQGRSILSDKGEGATRPRDDLEPPQITAIAKAAQSQALGEGFTEADEREGEISLHGSASQRGPLDMK